MTQKIQLNSFIKFIMPTLLVGIISDLNIINRKNFT